LKSAHQTELGAQAVSNGETNGGQRRRRAPVRPSLRNHSPMALAAGAQTSGKRSINLRRSFLGPNVG